MRLDDVHEAIASARASASSLDRIADILGIPVGAFADAAHAPRELVDTQDLLQAWGKLDDRERGQVLAYARSLSPGIGA